MSAVIAATCTCGGVGRTDLRQCPDHHHIWRGSKRLASVSSVLKLWPQKPCSSCGAISYDTHDKLKCDVWPKIENANRRGKEVDSMFSAWLTGRVQSIPIGSIGQDSKDLLVKLTKWFNARKVGAVESQVLVGDDEIGGVCDLWIDGTVMDLKCVYEVTDTHMLQIAAYHSMMLKDATQAAILHVTERYAEPRVIPVTSKDYADWGVLRDYWRVVQRRGVQVSG